MQVDTSLLSTLDPEELFALAVRASTANESITALACLKHCVAKAPEHARAHWLLGAEYASLAMPDRAQSSFEEAVRLDPQLHLARFQLGLLHLTSGRVDTALQVWEPLGTLPAQDPVRLFKEGLICMVRDEFDQALELVRQAIAVPGVEAALKRDMEMVVTQIEGARGKAAAAPSSAAQNTAPSPEPEAPTENHLLLSAYQRGLPKQNH